MYVYARSLSRIRDCSLHLVYEGDSDSDLALTLKTTFDLHFYHSHLRFSFSPNPLPIHPVHTGDSISFVQSRGHGGNLCTSRKTSESQLKDPFRDSIGLAGTNVSGHVLPGQR